MFYSFKKNRITQFLFSQEHEVVTNSSSVRINLITLFLLLGVKKLIPSLDSYKLKRS